MRGAAESLELLEPFMSLILALFLAIMVGASAFIFMDIITSLMASGHPYLFTLQLAGVSSAVGAAPQKAVYCYKTIPFGDSDVIFAKPKSNSTAALFLYSEYQQLETEILEDAPETPVWVGPLPLDFKISDVFEIKESRKIIFRVQKNVTDFVVDTIDEMSQCGEEV